MLARLVLPLLLFTLLLLFIWTVQYRAERREGRHDEHADDTQAPDTEPPREVSVAA